MSQNPRALPRFSLTIIAALMVLFCAPLSASAKTAPPPLSHAQIERIASKALATFHTPGLALGIVQGGKVRFAGGFGQRNLAQGQPVDADTLFRIASTTKAFTAAALAILVDEGVLHWDDKVIDIIPEFRMSDPWVTREFTLIDLLTHRSGLGRGAGDLMLWPEPSGFSREDIITNLRYLKPASSFRSQYAYDNLLYIVAGEVVARASHSTWAGFVQSRILDPLGMPCYAGKIAPDRLGNVAMPYGYFKDRIEPIERNAITGRVTASQPAGGLVCNARGMSIWMQTWLAGGLGPNGQRIFSEKQRDMLWHGQTILPISKAEREDDNTHFKTYALGWREDDVHGYAIISHTGTLSGMQAYVTLVPELDLGIVVLSNGSNYGVRNALTQSLLYAYMGQPQRDWVSIYQDRQAKKAAERAAGPAFVAPHGSGKMALPLGDYAGQFKDPWFGQVDIVRQGKALRFVSHKMSSLKGTLEPFEQNTFIVRWDNRRLGADAYARFETDFDGQITGMTMRLVDPDADFSFDFQDLNFARVGG